jgi:hypothetical protein
VLFFKTPFKRLGWSGTLLCVMLMRTPCSFIQPNGFGVIKQFQTRGLGRTIPNIRVIAQVSRILLDSCLVSAVVTPKLISSSVEPSIEYRSIKRSPTTIQDSLTLWVVVGWVVVLGPLGHCASVRSVQLSCLSCYMTMNGRTRRWQSYWRERLMVGAAC